MSLSLPTFLELSVNYPTGSHEAVLASIGGGVSASYILNGCVIRMSKAFNYLATPETQFYTQLPSWNSKLPSGKTIFEQQRAAAQKAKIHSIPKTYNFITHFTTTYGLDQKRYCFRVDEFFNYINHKYKKYDLKVEKQVGKTKLTLEEIRNFQAQIHNKPGIICFKTKFGEDAPGTSASGHFTLWDGAKCLYHEYFLDPRTTGIYLWKC
jgi:hypothetical protein